MKQNNYLSFITDEHLMFCIDNLFKAYDKAKLEFTLKKFYKNKIDIFKLCFDSKFYEVDDEALLKAEMLRQIDKTINNAIGTFHEEILGGINGYEKGNLSGYDIKAIDNTLFADIKNKHNTMNSSASEGLYIKLSKLADQHKKAICYWVQIGATSSFNTRWTSVINSKEYNHTRVHKISGDRFYALLTGKENALFELYQILPKAIDDYLVNNKKGVSSSTDSFLDVLKLSSQKANRKLQDQIALDNFKYYKGFDKL